MAKVYAVKEGRETGIFKTWDECAKQVQKYPGAKFKSFKTIDEAKEYLGDTFISNINTDPKVSDENLDELKWLLQAIVECTDNGDRESVKSYVENIADLFDVIL